MASERVADRVTVGVEVAGIWGFRLDRRSPVVWVVWGSRPWWLALLHSLRDQGGEDADLMRQRVLSLLRDVPKMDRPTLTLRDADMELLIAAAPAGGDF